MREIRLSQRPISESVSQPVSTPLTEPGVEIVGGGALHRASLFGRSPKALMQLVFREERLFLVLSVFIGVFSGLAAGVLRFAIDWCRIYLLDRERYSRR